MEETPSSKYELPVRAAEIPDGYQCDNCKERPAVSIWTEGVVAYVHACKAYWCEVCVLSEQIPYARAAAARLKGMEARLAELKKPHVHKFWGVDPETQKVFDGVCKCGVKRCEKCLGSGSVPTEWGCFGPKRFGRCPKCHGKGYPKKEKSCSESDGQ